MEDFCTKNSWTLVPSSTLCEDGKDDGANKFRFDPTINNGRAPRYQKFLDMIHAKLVSLGSQPRVLGMESQLIVKETSKEELDKMIENYRKEAKNGSTKVSLFGDQASARESMIQLRSFKNDQIMKNILQNNI